MINPVFFSGAFLGWGLGANDSANIFGTAVYTKVIRYWTAVLLTAVFVIIGAYVDGHRGIDNLSAYAYKGGIHTPGAAFFVMLAAGITVACMTMLKLPVSTSQAVIGAIIGGGILKGTADFKESSKFLSAWILTPFGAMVIAFVLYKIIGDLLGRKLTGFRFYETFIRIGYLSAGIFAAYSLGANNVANVSAIYAGELNLLNTKQAVLLGGISIAVGVLTFSKPVMSTVGEKLVPLSPIAGFIVVLAAAITVYVYALLGIPVSTSQAVVGAIVGIGLQMGVNTINKRVLRNILFGWFGTPSIAGIISIFFSLFI